MKYRSVANRIHLWVEKGKTVRGGYNVVKKWLDLSVLLWFYVFETCASIFAYLPAWSYPG